MIAGIVIGVLAFIIIFGVILPSIRIIGPTDVGLVRKRFSKGKLSADNPVAFNGEAGYQADLLMPGWRWKLWFVYSVEYYPWVQIPAGEIGVVIAQVGKPLPIGAKSAQYDDTFRSWDLRTFVEKGGEKGVQRPVLTPGTTLPIHPVGFLVITKNKVYGKPISPELVQWAKEHGQLSAEAFSIGKMPDGSPETLAPDMLTLTMIEGAREAFGYPLISEGQEEVKKRLTAPDMTLAQEGERIADRVLRERKRIIDIVGIVYTREGDPLPSGDIASRLGGFKDIDDKEAAGADREIIELILGSKNNLHNNYQDFQAFLDNGGKIGLQHDPLLYGTYCLNPFLVKVEKVPMLVVEQGEVAVIKAYVGLPTSSITSDEFKFGSIVKPGHRGIWSESLRTGKYALNPHCYQAEIVPTSIITLNWAEQTSKAHILDTWLSPIGAKSREGFEFKLDLQVQIHVPAEKAPRVISMVGTMQNLVIEVLHAAVGNHFRDTLQGMPAVTFIETRQAVQEGARKHIEEQLKQYEVETRGVYIQNVDLPQQIVEVLRSKEIANQQIEMYKTQKKAQDQRIEMEKSSGTAEKQKELAFAIVTVDIKKNLADARKNEAEGEAAYIQKTGEATGAAEAAIGIGKAKGYKAQVDAIGAEGTTLVNAITPISAGHIAIVPQVIVGSGDSLSGLAGVLMKRFNTPPEQTEENK